MKIEIVQAGLEDLDEIMAWRMEVLDHVFAGQSWDKEALYQANLNYYQKHLASHTHIALFAKAEGIPVGCGGICLYEEMPSPDNPTGKCGYIMNMYTRKKYRSLGIAGHIVQELIALASAAGAGKIFLESTEQAKRLYASLGFGFMPDYMKLEDGELESH